MIGRKAVACRQFQSLTQEDATGRFYASLAFRREIFDRIDGWPLTKRGDFDKPLKPPAIRDSLLILHTSSAGADELVPRAGIHAGSKG